MITIAISYYYICSTTSRFMYQKVSNFLITSAESRVSYTVMARAGETVFYVKFCVDFRSGLHFDLTGLT